MRSLMHTLPLIAALVAAVPLRADTVTATFEGVSPGQGVSVANGGTNLSGISAGTMNWGYVSGAPAFAPSFTSYCIELNRGVESTVTFTTAPLSSRFSDSQAARLQEFWGEHFAQVGNNAQNAAAFQLGIWEIVNESGTSKLDLSNGNFQTLTTGAKATDSATAALAQSWLDSVDGQGSFEKSLQVLDSATSQDQLTVGGSPPTVPVPPAAVLGGMGLLSLIGYGWRRRRLVVK